MVTSSPAGGGGGAADCETVTFTLADVALFPDVSVAFAARTCDPLLAVVVSHDTEYGLVASAVPRLDPSNKNCTDAIPVPALALAVTEIVPETVAPAVGEVMDTVIGAVLVLFTVIDTPALVALLFAVSVAIAVSVCFPFATFVVSNACEYGGVVSRDPNGAPSTSNCTLATPTLPAAVASTVIVPETVAPEAGDVIDTVGGVPDVLFFTVTVTLALVD